MGNGEGVDYLHKPRGEHLKNDVCMYVCMYVCKTICLQINNNYLLLVLKDDQNTLIMELSRLQTTGSTTRVQWPPADRLRA